MHVQINPKAKPITVMVEAATLDWLAERAAKNARSKCREGGLIIEAERHREARLAAPGCLGAQA